MKQPTIEFNVETDTCPRCGGHAFERVMIEEYHDRFLSYTINEVMVWRCLSCKQVIDYVHDMQ